MCYNMFLESFQLKFYNFIAVRPPDGKFFCSENMLHYVSGIMLDYVWTSCFAGKSYKTVTIITV